MVRTAVGVLVLCALALGCGADDDDSGGRAGTGLPVSGGGATGVSGVSGGGVSGMSGGGASGMSGGGASGMTAAGMSGSMAMAFVPGSPTWDAVYQEVLVDTGCSGGAYCHGGAAPLTGGLAMGD